MLMHEVRSNKLLDVTAVPEEQEAPKKKGPHDPNEINPKLASDIHYWAVELNVTGQQLHEAIRVHALMSRRSAKP
jgi:hypothetical protein